MSTNGQREERGQVPRKTPKHQADRDYRSGPQNRKYQGYQVAGRKSGYRYYRKPWFWKVLGISLLITTLIIAGFCFQILHQDKENLRAIEEINRSNNLEDMLEGHENMTITRSYSHLLDGENYTRTRQVRMGKKDQYFSYLKQEDSADDFKEVIDKGKLYRYKDDFSYFYGLISDDYATVCEAEIKEDIYQGDINDKVESSKVREKSTTMKLSHEIKEGEDYISLYGFDVGQTVEKVLVMDNKTQFVTSVEERVGDEVFFTYSVEFDGENKMPRFYQEIKRKTEKRTVKVYSDYNGENGKEYKFKVPYDVYFTMLDHAGYKQYSDEEGKVPYGDFQLQTQNPESDLILYVKPES